MGLAVFAMRRISTAGFGIPGRRAMDLDASHRSFPPPRRVWVLKQSWRDLLFAHWSLPVASLRALLPAGLAPDVFGDRAWIGVVPFRMAGVHLRGLPPVPSTSSFPELNVRTYVRVGETPGVYFFSLDATSKLVVATARRWFHLPYHLASMEQRQEGEQFHYRSRRRAKSGEQAVFEASYSPTGEVFRADRGSLEHWLTERYCLFSVAPDGRVFRGDVHHAPWPLQAAEATIRTQEGLLPHAQEAVGEPESLLFAKRIDVATWAPRVVYRPVSARRRE